MPDLKEVALQYASPALTYGELVETSSDVAWVNRWETWPSVAVQVRDQTGELAAENIRFAYWCAARRLHYSFAFGLLREFAKEAQELDGADPWLLILQYAGAVGVGEPEWDNLYALTQHPELPAGKAHHVYLTSLFTTRNPPSSFLLSGIAWAREAAAAGDLVAAYRLVSLLRIAGETGEAWIALGEVSRMLAENSSNAALADHLSERLIIERALLQSLQK